MQQHLKSWRTPILPSRQWCFLCYKFLGNKKTTLKAQQRRSRIKQIGSNAGQNKLDCLLWSMMCTNIVFLYIVICWQNVNSQLFLKSLFWKRTINVSRWRCNSSLVLTYQIVWYILKASVSASYEIFDSVQCAPYNKNSFLSSATRGKMRTDQK